MKFLLKAFAFVLVAAVLIGGGTFYWHPIWVSDQQIRYHLWRLNVKSEYVDVHGYRLHFLEALPPAGGLDKPVLLIHGLGSRGEDWAPMIPGLAAQGFHVYAPDLLGYGRSPRPDVDYSIALEEQTVLGFLDAVHVGKADVAGWSMGGWIAMKLAVDQPARVRRLLIYDSAGTYFREQPAPGLFTPTDTPGLERLMAALSPHPQRFPAFVARDALGKLQRNAWIVGRSMAQMQTGRDAMDFRLREIHQPMLIVWGSEDALIPLTTGEEIHRRVAGSVLDVVEGCGHLAPAECWKPVEAATLAFLKAEPAMAGGEHRIAGN